MTSISNCRPILLRRRRPGLVIPRVCSKSRAASATERFPTFQTYCAPKTCSYVVSGRLPASTLASIILGVLGGFASVCAVLFHGIYSVIRFFALGPERSDEDEEEEEVMSGHPPRAAGLFTGAGPPRPSGYAA